MMQDTIIRDNIIHRQHAHEMHRVEVWGVTASGCALRELFPSAFCMPAWNDLHGTSFFV